MGFEWDVRKAGANFEKGLESTSQSRSRYSETITQLPSRMTNRTPMN